jgi:hypothetical protein
VNSFLSKNPNESALILIPAWGFVKGEPSLFVKKWTSGEFGEKMDLDKKIFLRYSISLHAKIRTIRKIRRSKIKEEKSWQRECFW